MRYVQIVDAPAKNGNAINVTFKLTLRERDGSRRVVEDWHVVGLFARET